MDNGGGKGFKAIESEKRHMWTEFVEFVGTFKVNYLTFFTQTEITLTIPLVFVHQMEFILSHPCNNSVTP